MKVFVPLMVVFIAPAVFTTAAEARFLQSDPVGYRDDPNHSRRRETL